MALVLDALCTVDEVRAFAKLEILPDDDLLIESLINSVTQTFKNYCNVKSFLTSTYTEYYDGMGDKFLYPKNGPISSVTLLADDDDFVWGTDSTFESGEFRIIDAKGVYLLDDLFMNAISNVKITYTAGYDVVPDDLKQIAIIEVIRKYSHRRDFDVIRQTIGDQNTDYVDPGMLIETKQVLSYYCSFSFGV